jgi:hypothetical protein
MLHVKWSEHICLKISHPAIVLRSFQDILASTFNCFKAQVSVDSAITLARLKLGSAQRGANVLSLLSSRWLIRMSLACHIGTLSFSLAAFWGVCLQNMSYLQFSFGGRALERAYKQ